MMQNSTAFFKDAIPFILEGQVVSVADPEQMGRVKVWVQSLDGENFNVDQLPWAEYISPFGGFTVKYPGGANTQKNNSSSAYGFWAIPKIGSSVAVFCLNANPAKRCYFGAIQRLHRNRSLPAGRNTDFNGNVGPFGDTGDASGNLVPREPAYTNLREQFQNNVSSSQARTRGFYERQAAQAKNDKDGTEGYSKSPVDEYLDPQTYCWVTPGGHALILQDDPDGSRIRFKTGEGHQIIFDDTNERIYLSTAKGKSWVELDQDGHVHVFGAESLSFRSGKDVNIYADGNVNIEANNSINIKANTGNLKLTTGAELHIKANSDARISACGIFDIDSEKSLKITAALDIDYFAGRNLAITSVATGNIRAGGILKQTASSIHLNSSEFEAATAEKASCATTANPPAIVPGHEPWSRPVTSGTRNAKWKE